MKLFVRPFLLIPLFFLPLKSKADDLGKIIYQKILESEVFQKQNNSKKALEILEHLLTTYSNDAHLPDTSLARIYHKIGWNHYLLHNYTEAHNYTDKAVVLRTNNLPPDHPDLAISLFNRGAIYWIRGDLSKAQQDMLAAIHCITNSQQTTKAKADSTAAHYYTYLAFVTEDRRDHQTALLYWDKAMNYNLNKHGHEHPIVADYYYIKGAAAVQAGYAKKALALFLKAQKIYLKNEQGRLTDIARCFNAIGWAYSQQQQYKKAEAPFQKAIQYYLKTSDINALGEVYANLMQVYTMLDSYTQAERAYDKGVSFAQPINKYEDLAQLAWRKAALEYQKGNWSLAFKNYDQAIQWHVPSFTPNTLFENPNLEKSSVIGARVNLLDILAGKAYTLQKYAMHNKEVKYLEKALATYLSCDTLICQIRQSLENIESKYTFNQQIVKIYEAAISTALQLYERKKETQYLHQAYYLVARNKAVVLLESLQDQEAKKFAGLPQSIADKEKELFSNYYNLERQIAAALKENKNIDSLKSEKLEILLQQEQLIKQLEKDYPAYYELKYGTLNPIKINVIKSALPPNTALIEYFVGQSNIYLFAIDQENGLQYFKSKKPKEFEEVCRNFRRATESQDGREEQTTTFFSNANQLYNWLLEIPLQKLSPNINRLILIPDDELLSISFDLLLTEPVANKPSTNQLPLLIKDYAISYAYSNKLIFESHQAKQLNPNRLSFIGFGLEYDDYTLQDLGKLDSLGKSRHLFLSARSMGKLRYADDEVEEIGSLINGKLLLNQQATKENFLKEARKYNVVHLAMHSLLNEEKPMNSALIFSRPPDTDDYFLYASDIYSYSLKKAKMVVLSACNTGYGQLNRGEGIRNLSRAFTYAGSPSLITSLWNAPDKSTKEILVSFYQNLQKELPKDQALQAAKLEYLNRVNPEFSQPQFWAHLIAIGDPQNIKFESSRPTWQYVLLVLLALLLLLSFATRLKSKF